jgi:hypothetical protein
MLSHGVGSGCVKVAALFEEHNKGNLEAISFVVFSLRTMYYIAVREY